MIIAHFGNQHGWRFSKVVHLDPHHYGTTLSLLVTVLALLAEFVLFMLIFRVYLASKQLPVRGVWTMKEKTCNSFISW